jgi:uncharacterized membrane protein
VACFRRWRALDVLAFTGTAILYGAWHAEFYRKAAFEPALAWLAAFYAVFLVLPFLYHLRWREVTPVERFVLALANGTWFIAFAYRLMWPDMRHALGFVAAAAAAAYAALAAVQRRRNAADTRGIFGFVALAVAFLALAAPLHFGLHGTALAWTIEAPVLIYLGYRFAYRPLRTAGAVVLGLALGQVLARGCPEHDQVFVLVLNRRFAGAMSAAVFGWACAWVHQRRLAEATWLDRVLKVLAAVLSGLLALLVLHREVWQWCYLDHLFHQARWAVTLVWAVGGLAFVAAGLRLRSRPTWWTALVPLAAGLALGLAQYQYSAPDGQSLFANARFAAALVAVAAAVASGWLLARSAAATRAAPTLLTVGLVGLLAVLSVEVTEHCRAAASLTWDARGWAARMALSMTWAAYASGLLLVGFARRLRPLRLAALALFAVTALKAVFLDLAGVREGYRIILFLALGVLMIGASYLYHRAERLLEGRAEDDR